MLSGTRGSIFLKASIIYKWYWACVVWSRTNGPPGSGSSRMKRFGRLGYLVLMAGLAFADQSSAPGQSNNPARASNSGSSNQQGQGANSGATPPDLNGNGQGKGNPVPIASQPVAPPPGQAQTRPPDSVNHDGVAPSPSQPVTAPVSSAAPVVPAPKISSDLQNIINSVPPVTTPQPVSAPVPVIV